MIELRMVSTWRGSGAMPNPLREADRKPTDRGPDADSVGGSGGCALQRWRRGQLADYYPLIAQAVDRLEQNAAETRRTVYDRARAAMVAQLRGIVPPFTESDINLEQSALEKAIRKVETESAGDSYASPRPSVRRPAPPKPNRDASNERAEMSDAGELSQNTAPPPSSMVILANGGVRTGGDSAFAKKLAADQPNLSAELEVLQKEICSDHRRSLINLSARTLVPVTIVGLLVLSAAASGAY
jgi:hypothetical protein